eukprot:GHVO01009890.1.p1 GENE.GHVO01009890.1~~GHVO01009890.1.p1  ORF type:complete len:292 (+),score=36.70 GHVO01009890.1:32-877(+)
MADNDSVVISCLAKGLQRLFEQQSRGDRWVLDATSILNYLEEREKVARERNDGKPFLKYDASKSYRDILKKMDEQDDTSNVITAPLAGPEIVKKCSIHEKADEHDDVATTLESQKSETKSKVLTIIKTLDDFLMHASSNTLEPGGGRFGKAPPKEELEKEIADLVEAMKASSMGYSELLKKDEETLRRTSAKQQTQVDNTAKAQSVSGSTLQSQKWRFFQDMAMILCAGVLFLFTLSLILGSTSMGVFVYPLFVASLVALPLAILPAFLKRLSIWRLISYR